MEWTHDGRLLVSEHTAGRVTDITEGGDFRTPAPFAEGLEGPTSILPLRDGRILVSEMWGGRITDISKGGDVSSTEPFADGIVGPYSLATIGGRVFAVDHPGEGGSRIMEIKHKDKHHPWVTNVPGIPLPGMEGLTPHDAWPNRWQQFFFACKDWTGPGRIRGEDRLVLNTSTLGQLWIVPEEGGDFSEISQDDSALLAKGLGHLGGMIQHPQSDEMFITMPRDGSVMAIDLTSRGKDYRFTPPVVRGLNMPTCVRFSPDGQEMYVCSFAVGGVWRITNW